jgi:hypothetical protein
VENTKAKDCACNKQKASQRMEAAGEHELQKVKRKETEAN